MTTVRRYVRQVVAPNGRHRKPPRTEPVPREDGTDTPESTGASDE